MQFYNFANSFPEYRPSSYRQISHGDLLKLRFKCYFKYFLTIFLYAVYARKTASSMIFSDIFNHSVIF